MAINSSTFDTRAGEGSIIIDPDDDIGSLPSTTMAISDIGTLSIEFDIEEDAEDVNNVIITPAKFNFKVFDRLGDGSSLFNNLDNVLSTTDVKVEFSFTTDSGLSWDDDLYFTTNNIEYDRVKREVSFEARYKNTATLLTISDIFSSYQIDEFDFNDGNQIRRSMAARDFIENVLNINNQQSIIINNSNNFSDNPFVDGNDTWVILEDNDAPVFPQITNANQALYRLAAADGSVVASMMGYSFFTYRLDTTEDVSVSESVLESLKVQPSLSNYRNMICLLATRIASNFVDSWASIGALFEEGDGINPDATKSMLVNYVMQELQPASWDNTNIEFDDDGFVFTSPTNATISEEPKEGDTVFEVDSDPLLDDGDVMTVNDDIRGINIVKGSDANRIETYDPWRGYRGSIQSVQQYVNFNTSLAQGAINAYAKAYGADGSRRIECTFFDIDTLKPYETFTLDSSLPESVRNQTYRPSELEYDLKTDRINVKAYQIA